jgi:hypothetical protein
VPKSIPIGLQRGENQLCTKPSIFSPSLPDSVDLRLTGCPGKQGNPANLNPFHATVPNGRFDIGGIGGEMQGA